MNLAQVFKRECVKIYGKCKTCFPCPDMFTALIDVDRELFCPILSSYENLKDWNLPTIAIVLESPHKFEYDDNGLPIGPARGTSGQHISSGLIKKHLKKYEIHGRYKLLLIEAISFQCSNATNLKEKRNADKRDDLFKCVWERGGKKDFETRLKMYKPKYVINSCTGHMKNIDSKKTLNSLVQDVIDKVCAKIEKFYSSHPSSPQFLKTIMKKRG